MSPQKAHVLKSWPLAGDVIKELDHEDTNLVNGLIH
jgi:hypothetical protein